MVYNEKKVELLRQRYPKGTRICLDSMKNDPFPIPSGSKGSRHLTKRILHYISLITMTAGSVCAFSLRNTVRRLLMLMQKR